MKKYDISTAHWVFFLLVVTAPLIKSVNLPIIGERLAIFEVVFILLSLSFVGQIFKHGEFEISIPIEVLPLTVLVVAASTALFNTYSIRLGVLNLVVLIYYLFLIIIAVQLLDEYDKVYYAINAYVFASLVVIVAGVLGLIAIFLDISSPFVDSVSGRLIATFRAPNQLPAFLVTSFPLLVLHPKRKLSRTHSVSLGLFAFTCVVVVIGSGSDWGFAILLLETMLLIAFKLYSTDSFQEIIALGIIAGVLLFGGISIVKFEIVSIPPAIKSSFSLFLLEDVSLRSVLGESRYKQFFVGLPKALQAHPLVGVGLGTFASFMSYHVGIGASMHNTFLGVITGAGIIGAFSFLYFLLLISKRLFATLRNPINDDWRDLTGGILLALLGIMCFQLAHYGLRWRHFWLLFVFAIVIGQVNSQKQHKHKVDPPE